MVSKVNQAISLKPNLQVQIAVTISNGSCAKPLVCLFNL